MNRKTLIQDLINHKHYKSYLEIGVFNGETFLPIKCKQKVAVDPYFRISGLKQKRWRFKNFSNFSSKFYEMTSEEFFESKALLEKHAPFGMVFIDGLHTYEASLKDALNSLKHLKNKGTIVMHDCFPPHRAAATPAKSYEDALKMGVDGWTGEWCGDVWKTIVYLKEKYANDLKIATLNEDYGLGIIQIENFDLNLKLDKQLFDSINKMNYEQLAGEPKEFLNLKEVDELGAFL